MSDNFRTTLKALEQSSARWIELSRCVADWGDAHDLWHNAALTFFPVFLEDNLGDWENVLCTMWQHTIAAVPNFVVANEVMANAIEQNNFYILSYWLSHNDTKKVVDNMSMAPRLVFNFYPIQDIFNCAVEQQHCPFIERVLEYVPRVLPKGDLYLPHIVIEAKSQVVFNTLWSVCTDVEKTRAYEVAHHYTNQYQKVVGLEFIEKALNNEQRERLTQTIDPHAKSVRKSKI